MSKLLAVVSVIGRDQKGVVARFATYLAQRGVNIEDLEQQVVHGQFIMDMLVDLSDMSARLDEMVTGLLELGRDIGMEVRVAFHDRPRRRRVVLLVSRELHCLHKLIQDHRAGLLRGDLVAVLGNHPDLGPAASEQGLAFDWHSAADKPAHMAWLLDRLKGVEPDLILLARYMQVLSPEIVRAFPNRIINIHPSLLPHFPGAHPYRQAWESGVRVTGCTAHFVTEALDEGPIVLQDVFHIDVGRDTAEDVKRKGQSLEAQTLSRAAQMFLDEKLVVVQDKVVFRPGLSTFFDHRE